MKHGIGTLLLSLALLLLGCGSEQQTASSDSDRPPYVVLDTQLTQFMSDFNAMTNKVRLVFISGPSCGICLRGMDDLNHALVASIQNDSRIHTFVLQVPTLGAEEKHAAAAVPLMPGPRVNHYWDPEGQSGMEFMPALGIDVYAWDVWMMYEPGARWETDKLPPAPTFWQHQLGSLPDETPLDADRFASVVTERLDQMPAVSEATRMAEVQREDPGVFEVAQPRGVMIQSNHRSRGGYQKLKGIDSIRYEGETDIDGQVYAMTVETQRPYRYERAINHDGGTSRVSFDGANVTHDGTAPGALPEAIRDHYLSSYEFDGWMTDWKAKGHKVWRLGMKKHKDRLPWLMEAELTNGRTWHIYVDSHTGDAFRQVLVDSDGQEFVAVEFDDYRDADGFRLPHEIRYFEGDKLLATDRFHRIAVTMSGAPNQ